MADFYVKSGQATERANSTAYALGNKMVPLRSDASTNNAVAKRWVWECTVAGTSGAAVPTWPASVTQDTTTVTDGTVTWQARKPGFSSGTTANWTFASPYLDFILSGTAAGDRIFVSNNHSESSAVAITHSYAGTTTSPTIVLCVDDSAAPPTTVATGAIITTTGASAISVAGIGYTYGITYQCGTGTSAVNISLVPTDGNSQQFEQCTFRLVNTAAGSRFVVGGSASGHETDLVLTNCNLRAANASQRINLQQTNLKVVGGGLQSGGTALSGLVTGTSAFNAVFTGFDCSNGATNINLVDSGLAATGNVIFRRCKMPASWSGTVAAGDPSRPGTKLAMYGVDSGADVTRFQERYFSGSTFSENTIVRTGGASASWRMASSANAEFPLLPLISPEIYFENTATGSPITVTVEVITDNVTLTDQHAWLEVISTNTASSVNGTLVSDWSTPIATATNQPTSSEAWTTTGITTPVKQKLSVTFTPQVAGDIIAVVKLARANTTVYVDPKVVVT